ncbi:hypothetical protein B0H14DRAFT_3864771 [Mycena olivaceomarginata]|nr:hypothetical protein B0H14DRAFT_3864771 [Mycena olivaceomarginata]
MAPLKGEHIWISEGLQDQDAHFETLSGLFEELGVSSFDIASQPECDLALEPAFDEVPAPNLQTQASSPPPAQVKAGPSTSSVSVDSDDTWFTHYLRCGSGHTMGLYDKLNWFAPETNAEDWGIKPEHWDNNLLYFSDGSSTAQGPQDMTDTGLQSTTNDSTDARSAGASRQPAVSTSTTDAAFAVSPTSSWYAHALQMIAGARKPSGPGTLPPPVAPAALSVFPSGIMPFTTWQANTPETTTRSNPTSHNIVAWEDSPVFRGALNNVPRRPIGIVYLAASPFVLAPPEQAGVGELNFGVVIESASRGKGYASEALQLVLKHAFDVARCHRVQASLLGSAAAREGMMRVLTQMRFGHEGTKRRAFFHPLLREWQDVTTLALLDMDWALRASLSKYKAAPKSLWDELFLRHERERDELLRWEEGRGRAGAMGVKRSASVETLRAVPMALEPDSESDAGEVKSAWRQRTGDPAIYDGASSDAESEFDEGARKRTALDLDRSGASSPALSDISLQSVPSSVTSSSSSAGARSPPSTPSASGSGSDWDLMESDSSSSFGDD